MKKRILFFCFLFFLPSILLSQAKDTLTLSDIFDSDKFSEESLEQAQWIPGSDAFTFLKTDSTDSITSIHKHDVKTGKESVFLDGNTLQKPGTDSLIEIEDYKWSEDGSKMLIQTDTEEIWRSSIKCRFYIYDVKDKTIQSIFDGEEKISNAMISPDGIRVGYVFENNIYALDLLTGNTRKLTDDGSEELINGRFDWVYEEEFSITEGWQWAPDGKKIVFWRLDQSLEPEFSWTDYNPLHQSLTTIRYPKAGEKNALVKIGVIDLESKETVWMDIGEEMDIYIPQIKWTKDADVLSIQRLNRLQNRLELMLADVRTGETRTILVERDSCWVDIHDNLIFLHSTDQFIWTSERSGYNHIYLYRNNGELIRQVTNGNWEVRKVYGVDEQEEVVYYASNQEDVTECHIYKIQLDGKNQKRLTAKKGWHSADFSPDFRYFINLRSNFRTPDQWVLFSPDGNKIRMLVENEMSVLDDYELFYPELLKIEMEDGEVLYGYMIKPLDFDENRKYPVLIDCYGGPTDQIVRNEWYGEWFLWHNFLGQRGYIVFGIDNRGTPGRGKDFVNMAYGDVAKWAVHDHMGAAKYLGGLSYVDQDRIGIWGCSFGGYLTLLAMTKGSDYFKTGVAFSPVVCFRLYDTIYTERYMGLPQENPEGYDSASVFSYIDRLKGNLLIIHGMADDNVHVQNTMQLVEKLQSHGKQFNLMLYPGKNHMIPNAGDYSTIHLFTLVTNYVLKNL